MKEHHDELLQNIAKASHQYNELQDLFQKKQKMIVEETTKFVENVNQYFETYINELRQTQQKIIAATENTRQNAQVKNRIPMVGLISFYFFRILYRKLVLVYKRLVSLFRP
jgi:GTPase SAR1 family protein